MKLGEAGEAFFVEELTTTDVDVSCVADALFCVRILGNDRNNYNTNTIYETNSYLKLNLIRRKESIISI